MNSTLDSRRIEFLGCPLDLLSPQEVIEQTRYALTDGPRLRLEGLNVAKLVDARATPFLMQALREAERVHIDGAGISLGLKALGIKAPPRCAGIDLMGLLCEMAAATGASVATAAGASVTAAGASVTIAAGASVTAGTGVVAGLVRK